MMIIPSIGVAHVLALFLLVIYPAWDYFDTRELRKGADSRTKLRYYKKTALLFWLASIAAVWSLGAKLFTLHVGLPRFAASHALLAQCLAAGLAISIAIVLVLPQFQALSNARVREKLMKQYAHLSFFMPSTAVEFRWYTVAAITAGICEETVYRGFLIHYLGIQPWHLGIAAAVVISSLAFGAAHLYMGAKALLSTTISGLIFCALFLLTGNLLLPVIVHGTVDLIAVPLLRRHLADHPKLPDQRDGP
jgi:membrane protease YdiL (CAAX protease family)